MSNTIQIQSNEVAKNVRNFAYDQTKDYGYSSDNREMIMISELIKNQQWRAIQIVIENMDSIYRDDLLELIFDNTYIWNEIFEPIENEVIERLKEHKKIGSLNHLLPFFFKNKKFN